MTQAANPTANLVRDSKTGIYNARWWVPRPEHERQPGQKKFKEKRESLGTRDLAEARRKVKAVMSRVRAVRDGHLEESGGKRSNITWEEVRKAFEADDDLYPRSTDTRKRYDIDLRRFGAFLADSDLRPAEIDERAVKRFVAELRGDELKTSTIKNALTAVSRAMQAAHYAEIVSSAAVGAVRFYDRSRLRNDSDKARPPMGDEVERLNPQVERIAGPHMALFVLFKHRTGCRAGELLAARAEDIHREPNGLHLWLNRRTKRGRKRSILLNAAEELLPLLPKQGRLFAALPDDVAYVSGRWATFWSKRAEAAEISAMLEGRGVTEWEERRWRLHDLRHAFACEALLAKADIYALRDHLGHASVLTTEGYTKTLRELPVAQQRPLKLFWRGKTEDDRRRPMLGEQPRLPPDYEPLSVTVERESEAA